MPRKPKYSPEVVDKITQALAVGAPVRVAARYGGVDPSTYYDWVKRYPAFASAVEAAENNAAMKWIDVLATAATQDWRAALAMLERRYPDDWGRRRLEVTGAGGRPVELAARAVPPLPDHVVDAILQPAAAVGGKHPHGDLPDDPGILAMLE